MQYDYDKIREYYNALAEMKEVFAEASDASSMMVEANLVAEYQKFLRQAEQDLPGLLVTFDDRQYFSHSSTGRSHYYHAEGIRAHIGRNLGILKTKKDSPTSSPFTEVKSFSCVANKAIQSILERDYQEIQRSIIAANWKSAIILSGGSIEAVLLDLLHKDEAGAKASAKAPSKPNLGEWHLHDLIEVAVDTGLVSGQIAKLSHSVREYRNLIHPGVEVRGNLKVEPEEANIAVEVLKMLVRELS